MVVYIYVEDEIGGRSTHMAHLKCCRDRFAEYDSVGLPLERANKSPNFSIINKWIRLSDRNILVIH